jgi:hypothetical protein
MKAQFTIPLTRFFVSSTTFGGLVLTALFAAHNLDSVPSPLPASPAVLESGVTLEIEEVVTPRTPSSTVSQVNQPPETLDSLTQKLESLNIPSENLVLHELRQSPTAIAPCLVKFSKALEVIQSQTEFSLEHSKVLMNYVSDCAIDINAEEHHEMARAYCFDIAKKIKSIYPEDFEEQLIELKDLVPERVQRLSQELIPVRVAILINR